MPRTKAAKKHAIKNRERRAAGTGGTKRKQVKPGALAGRKPVFTDEQKTTLVRLIREEIKVRLKAGAR